MADVNVNTMRLKVNAPTHPIFNGVALDSTNLMVNPYARRVTFTNAITGVTTNQTGISINNNAIVAGGTVLAVVGTAGSAGLNGMVIGEVPAGVTTVNQVGSYVLGGRRLAFLTGSRESGITGDGSGIYDLFPDGAQLLTNAVTYLTTSQAVKCTVPLVGATNLVAGDAWTFSAGPIGDPPLTYQWKKDGLPLVTGTDAALSFPSLTTADAGEYQLFVTNAAGYATSTLARLAFLTFAPANLTNSVVSYWPLDQVVGSKTPDLVSGYDMTLVNITGTNIVAGKWGNAFRFYEITKNLLARTHNAGEALPIYQHNDFTVSLWVNAPMPTGAIRDRRAFSEGSTTNGNPLFNIGTDNRNPPVDGSVDIYIRRDNGSVDLDHLHSTGIAYDGASWHNIVYVQRRIGEGRMKAQLWVDGVLDPLQIAPVRPLTAQITSIGGVRRSSDAAWFEGMIDDVTVWNRALSAEEVGILQVTAITNPPSRTQPLVINSFKADLPAVVAGGSTILRWDVSKDASQVTISPLGDVLPQTSVGIGARSITNTQTTTYVLSVSRGVDTLSATTSVAVVQGVAPGWKVLDNFDQAQLGNLFNSGYWNDTSGNGGQVVLANGNPALRTTSAGISFLNLRGLSIQETQTCTLFFRIIPGADDAAGITNIVGLTDKSQRSYGDEFANIGPVLYPTPFTNVDYAVETNGWYLGARNNPGGLIDYLGTQPTPQIALESGGVYNVWMDITNAPMGESASDIFTVHIQKEGGAPRTVLFQDFSSDRDFFAIDPVLGGMTPVLDKLVVMGNSATLSATFYDFYLSSPGYNATVPKAYRFALPPGPVSVGWSGNQLQFTWTNGTLQSSTNVNGPYVDVPGNPASPYLVAPTGAGTFYRTRQ